MATSALVKDNKSELAVPRKLNSCKANLNRCRKYPWLKLAAGTFIKNSNNELVVYRGWLVKGKHNPSAQEPILVSNSGTEEIAINNSKLLQPITKPKGTH